ncbi:hypothetical protein N0V84_002986 [Fusarium piperis]|uniref:Uncharacterized protein n=1 Tax=Fusarium piperis TaxID=1435070 RepID=A0A9W8WIC8_9HYPO|nr:hypothetical protein N0V84_002986 [Fusarium piperis]
MGGKVWSTDEERVFWEVVVPVSPNAANPAKRLLSWGECVELMKREIGADARREYTQTMLYEHHYQNFKPGAKSPKANPFLEKHLRDIEWFKKNKTSPPPTPAQAPTSDDPFLASLLNDKNKPKPKTKRGRKASPVVCHAGLGAAELYKLVSGSDHLAALAKSFTPINQGGRNSLANPVASTTTTSARNTVTNSSANTAANSFAKNAAKSAASSSANSFANPFASNSGSSLSSLASSGQRKLPKVAQRQIKSGALTQTIRQPTSSQTLVAQSSSGPNTLLSRQSQSFGSGTQGMAPGVRQDVRRTQGLSTAGTTNQVHGSSSYVPFYQGYAATSQQTPAQTVYQTSFQIHRESPIQHKEEGPIRLPSIREMFPFTFTGPEQEAYARREADVMLLNRKRSISVEDEQMSAPKRRPLPDRPTPRQN